VVKGMPFGHALTQFCELPHSCNPPAPINAFKRSSLVIEPVGCKLNNLTCEIACAPTKSLFLVTFGQTSKHTPHVIHLDYSYVVCCFLPCIRGPVPRSYVPSIGTHAFIRFKLSIILLRSTCKSRITGNVLIGSNFIGCSN